MFVWPGRDEVIAALRSWAGAERERNPNVIRVGYFGSLRRDDYGVGSDADLVVIVRHSGRPWAERPLELTPPNLPVSADVLVYTEEEWPSVIARGDRFAAEMSNVVWV